ncbi:hypothetical protein LXL04_002867 [Taraxacum kok-saghyz]
MSGEQGVINMGFPPGFTPQVLGDFAVPENYIADLPRTPVFQEVCEVQEGDFSAPKMAEEDGAAGGKRVEQEKQLLQL